MTIDEIRKIYATTTDNKKMLTVFDQEYGEALTEYEKLKKKAARYSVEEMNGRRILCYENGYYYLDKDLNIDGYPMEVLEYMVLVKKITESLRKLNGINAMKKKLTDIQEAPVYPPAAAAVINEYPQFAKDLPLLKKHNVITDTGTGYKWEKSKVSLSEYFGNMGHKPTPWKMIGNLFNETGLKNSFSSNGSAYGKNKPSADYIEIQKILENTP